MLICYPSSRVPGAAQHHSARKTRVNPLMVVRCRPGIVANSVWNGPASAVHRSAIAARCTACGTLDSRLSLRQRPVVAVAGERLAAPPGARVAGVVDAAVAREAGIV